MKKAFVRLLLLNVVLLIGCAAFAQREQCEPKAWRATFAMQVFPQWRTSSPDNLSRRWPGRLVKIAEGSGEVWGEEFVECAAYFSFRQESSKDLHLWRVRLTGEAKQRDLVEMVSQFAFIVGPQLTPGEIDELRADNEVNTHIESPTDDANVLINRRVVIVPNEQRFEVIYDRIAY